MLDLGRSETAVAARPSGMDSQAARRQVSEDKLHLFLMDEPHVSELPLATALQGGARMGERRVR
jgi:hypothetical protein